MFNEIMGISRPDFLIYGSFFPVTLTSNLKGISFLFFFFKFIYLRERVHVSVQEQGRGRQSGKERIPSWPCAVSAEPHLGLDPTNREIMTQAQTKSQLLNLLSHSGSPSRAFLTASLLSSTTLRSQLPS